MFYDIIDTLKESKYNQYELYQHYINVVENDERE